MIRLERVLRKSGNVNRPRVWGVLAATSIILTFDSSTTDADGGIFAVVGSVDAEQRFSFTEITPRVALPADLEISESGVLKMVVTFPLDYTGAAYNYTDTNGAAHAGTFPSGNNTVNY